VTYHFSKTLDLPLDAALTATREALGQEGLGVITEVDIRATMKAKLDEDFRAYTILGACNPRLAFEALQLEDKVGAMLPCNVVVQDAGGGRTEVSAIDPVASMQAIDNNALKAKAAVVADKLKAAIERL